MKHPILVRIAAAVAALAFLALVMAWLAGVFSPTIEPDRAERPREPVAGTVVPVESVLEPLAEQNPGTVRARREAVISPRITAGITAVNVRAGDSVSEGEVLIELDARELEARLRQRREQVAAAQARVAEARPQYERIRNLFESGVVARAELDRAEAALRSARAELARARDAVEEAETALSYATIRAPITGRVIDRLAEPGDTATPARPLLRLYDPRTLRLDAHVPETLGTRLERGRALAVHIDAIDRRLEGAVDEIVPSAEPGSRTFLVRVSLPARPDLYPGMFGRLIIPVGEERRIYVPRAAITRVGQLELVRVVTGEGAVRRYVRTGRADEARVEVLSGLAAGERVVVPD